MIRRADRVALQFRLDRKTWIAVTTAALLLTALPLFPVARFVIEKVKDRSERAFYPETDDVERLPGGSTILLKHDPGTRRIVDWLHRGTENHLTVEFPGSNFSGGTTSFTPQGWQQLTNSVRVLRAYRDVRMVILFAPHHDDPSTLEFERLRAERIHDEMLRQGAREKQVSVDRDAFEAGEDPANEDGLELALVREAQKVS